MAPYIRGQRLTQSNGAAFDSAQILLTMPRCIGGIYRCTSCGDEVAIAGGPTIRLAKQKPSSAQPKH